MKKKEELITVRINKEFKSFLKKKAKERGVSLSKLLFENLHDSYHSDNFESILWYLNKYKPGLKIITIASVEQENLENLDELNEKKADFILVVDSNMTKTH